MRRVRLTLLLAVFAIVVAATHGTDDVTAHRGPGVSPSDAARRVPPGTPRELVSLAEDERGDVLPASPAWSSSSPRSPTSLTMFYHPPKDWIEPSILARQVGAVVFTSGDEWYRDLMWDAGFKGPVLLYLMANEASGPSGVRSSADRCRGYPSYRNNVTGIAGDFCSALHGDERNFLHNGRGERLYTTQSWWNGEGMTTSTLYLMNPGSPTWQAYFAKRARENLNALTYFALFLDNVDLTLDRARRLYDNSDGVVREYATDDAYRQAVAGYLQTLRRGVGTADVWANMTSEPEQRSDSDWDQYLPYLDGVMDEYFVARWRGTLAKPPVWEAQVRQAEKVLEQWKSFIAVGQGPRQNVERMRFALASYLLIAREGAHFRYADSSEQNRHGDPYAETWYYDDYAARLGDPVGPRYQVAGHWRRDFTCGYVSVDVEQRVGSIVVHSSQSGCW